MRLREHLAGTRVIVVAGPGGVGKTTTAAALGATLAASGQRALVATIDPAPRLLDALGLEATQTRPRPVPTEVARALDLPEHTESGQLLAMRIDPAQVFGALVEEAVPEPEIRARILANPIYTQITTTLSGTQEIASMLALEPLANDAKLDALVLDTPPASNALDFFEAPGRIRAAVESPIIRALLGAPTSRFSLRRLTGGGAFVLERLSRLVGSRFLDDVASFLRDFEPVLEIFLKRSEHVEHLLHSPKVALVLVTAPEAPAVDETLHFIGKLRALGFTPKAVVMNRILPPPGMTERQALLSAIRSHLSPVSAKQDVFERGVDRLVAGAQALARLAETQRAQQARLAALLTDVSVFGVPLHTEGTVLDGLRATMRDWA